jgi:hypothetical protein
MGEAFDDERLAIIQPAYDHVLHDLFGDTPPEQHIRESIACTILYTAKTSQNDWKKIASEAGSRMRIILV